MPSTSTNYDTSIVNPLQETGIKRGYQAEIVPIPVERPSVVVTGRRDDVIVTDYINAIQESNAIRPWVFRRGRDIVYPREASNGTIYLAFADEAAIDYIINQCANTLKAVTTIDAEGSKHTQFTPAPVPRRLLSQILRYPKPPFPSVNSVIHVPGFRRDGTLYTTPGYDAMSETFYDPCTTIPDIPDEPTPEDVQAAKDKLYDILDFPFTSQTDRANALALALTLICRQAINDVVPMAVVNAISDKGTGKTFLVQMLYLMATGQEAPVKSLPDEDAETRKVVTTIAEGSEDFAFFDNVRGTVRSKSLEAVLTSLRWNDRILGTNRSIDANLRVTWAMTGNHVVLGGDLGRRTYFIHLNQKLARAYYYGATPETERRYPDMREFIAEHQGEFLAALLTIARAWFAAGQPLPKNRTLLWGTYRKWCHMISGMLEFANIEGFLATHEADLDEQSEEEFEYEGFFTACYEQFGDRPVGAGEIVAAMDETESNAIIEALPGQLVKEKDKNRLPRSFAVTLGHFLKNRRNHPIGRSLAFVEEAGRDKHAKKALWRFGVQQPVTPESLVTLEPLATPEPSPVMPASSPMPPVQNELTTNEHENKNTAVRAQLLGHKPPNGHLCPGCHNASINYVKTPEGWACEHCQHVYRPIVISGKVSSWR